MSKMATKGEKPLACLALLVSLVILVGAAPPRSAEAARYLPALQPAAAPELALPRPAEHAGADRRLPLFTATDHAYFTALLLSADEATLPGNRVRAFGLGAGPDIRLEAHLSQDLCLVYAQSCGPKAVESLVFGFDSFNVTDPYGECFTPECLVLAAQGLQMAQDLWSERGTATAGMARSTAGFAIGYADLLTAGSVSSQGVLVQTFANTEGGFGTRAGAALKAAANRQLGVVTLGTWGAEDKLAHLGNVYGSSKVASGTQKFTLGLMDLDLAEMVEGAGEATEGASSMFVWTAAPVAPLASAKPVPAASSVRTFNVLRQPGQAAVRNAGPPRGLKSLVAREGATEAHHTDPKFMGGDPKQPLTTLMTPVHRLLHKWLNQYLRTNVDEFGSHMRPQRGNTGAVIRQNFSRQQRLEALAEYYKNGEGSMSAEAVKDFFKQHPELK